MITKLAVVGSGFTEKPIADLAHPNYAQESRSFQNQDQAWEWFDF